MLYDEHEFYLSSLLCDASFKCKYENNLTHMLITKITQFAYFVLTKTVENLHKLTQLLLFNFLICVFYPQSLPLAHWWVRNDWKKRNLWVALSLSFSVIIFSTSSELVQWNNMRKKGHDRVPWSFMFLRMWLPSVFEASFGSNGKCGLSWLLASLPHAHFLSSR